MKKIILILLCLPLLASAQDSAMVKVVHQYKGEQYKDALKSAEILRKKTRGAQLAPLDLIIASCLCLTGDDTGKGLRALDQMINNYRLSPKMEKVLQDLRRNCQDPINEDEISLEMLAEGRTHQDARMVERSIGGSGKDFTRTVVEVENIITISGPLSDLPSQDLEIYDRVFDREQKAEAKAYFDQMYDLYIGSQQATSKYFIIYSSGNLHKAPSLKLLGERLDGLIESYAAKFQLEIPSKLIAIHLGHEKKSVQKQSLALYGFVNETGNIGYSSISSFSILTYVNGNPLEYPGTIYHELMHILLNHNAPFLPPWLAEGLPALYEASKENGQKGVHNWRGERILSQYKPHMIPSSLLEMNWNEFDGIFEDGEYLKMDVTKKSLNHATARYFVFYLQEQGWLEEVTQGFVNYHYGDPSFDQYDSDKELLAAKTGQTIEQLQKNFMQWLSQMGYIKSKREARPAQSNVPFKKG